MAVRLVMFGRQGAGKGTQCVVLAKHYGAPHISTGDMLRAAVAEGSAVGKRAKEIMDAGQLMPDDAMADVVRERLQRGDVARGGFLLDGYPRTVPQAEILSGLTDVDLAIDLDVPEDEVRARMLGRARADDTPEAIDERLALYARETVPTIEWYAERGLLERVDGLGTPEAITARLITAVDVRLARRR